jgi:hypothetical protein
MEEIKTIKLTKIGKVDMRGKSKTKRLTEEQVKTNAYKSCKNYYQNHKQEHNESYKKYYEKNKEKINEQRKLKKTKMNVKKLVKFLEPKLTKIWRIKCMIV